jgi:hypothetical protein
MDRERKKKCQVVLEICCSCALLMLGEKEKKE